jgi:hypothetical protein
MIDTTGIDEFFARLEETDRLKKQAIEQLLDIRKQIDEKLSRLGYVGGGNTQGLSPKGGPRKRHRRTKAEIEAARQVAAKTAELPGQAVIEAGKKKAQTSKG